MNFKEVVYKKIWDKLKPVYLDVINESYMHNVPKDSNTHFKIVIVCDNFENIPLIQRHRLINQILTDELKTTIHALSIVAQTSSQWNKNSIISKSPACLGGMLKDSHVKK